MTIWNLHLLWSELKAHFLQRSKLIGVHTQAYYVGVNSIFCMWTPYLAFHFFTHMLDIYSWNTNNTFLQVLTHLRYLDHMSKNHEDNFWVGKSTTQLHLWIHICVVLFNGPLHLWLPVPYMSYLRWWGVRLHLWNPSPVLFITILFALCLHIAIYLYFSGGLLIFLNDNFELTLLCRLGDFFKDEIDRCSYSLLLGKFHFLLWTPFFIYFSHVYQICVDVVLITDFAGTAI